MKTPSKVLCLFCAAALTLGACQQNAYLLQNTPDARPAAGLPDQTRVHSSAAPETFAPATSLAEWEFQLEQFSSRFFGSMSLPHQPVVRQ